jgi:hypothetical protein
MPAQEAKERNDAQTLREALEDLVNAKALAGIRELVAGWNGEGLPQPHAFRHPPRLGADIRTNCGAVYALDEAMQRARAVLASAPIAEEQICEPILDDECPHCGSSAPHLHPSVQVEGEVELCTHEFHLRATSQNTPAYIASVLKKRQAKEADALNLSSEKES